jgi:hypothetical protein
MQKVVGSSPIIRSIEGPAHAGFSLSKAVRQAFGSLGKEKPPRRAAFPVIYGGELDDYPHTPLQVPSMPKKPATSPV